MARRVLIIANPMAGRGRRGAARLRRVVEALERRGCFVAVRQTQAPGEAECLARNADPAFDVIVAAGGDGTVNEVVNGLGEARLLAVLPLGTGNVLANEIGMPRTPEAIARVIAEAPPRPIWPGRAGDRLFVAMAGIGFDAAVLSALDQRLKRRIGKLAFVWALLRCLHRFRDNNFIVELNGQSYRVASAIIANGRRYAGRFVVAPAARLAEPELHAVLFCGAGRAAALRGLAALALARLHRLKDVSVVAAAAPVTVSLGDDQEPGTACLVEIDGEVAGRLPITINIAERPLLLVQPRLPNLR